MSVLAQAILAAHAAPKPAGRAWAAPTISDGRQRMPDLPDSVKARAVAPIIEIAARAFRVTPASIRSPLRTAELVRARHAAMWIAKRFTGRSLPEIGRAFGGRDHTTVLHGVRKVDAVVAAIGAPAEDTAEVWAARLGAAVWLKALSQRD